MSRRYTGLLGYDELFKERSIRISYIDPGFLDYVDAMVKLQFILFVLTVITLLYSIFKYSEFGLKVRSLYTIGLDKDDAIFRIRYSVSVALLYYYFIFYCILFPRLFVDGVYWPAKMISRDLVNWSTKTLKFILLKVLE